MPSNAQNTGPVGSRRLSPLGGTKTRQPPSPGHHPKPNTEEGYTATFTT